MKGHGKLAWPLMQQLKKDIFHLGLEAQLAFEQLKQAMTD